MTDTAAPTLHLDVPVDLDAVEDVRDRVTETASGWGMTDLSDLEVVTSELVTNAIVHAGSPSVVELTLVADGCVELTVADADSEPPVMRIPYEQHTRGLGLHIVDALVTEWGVREGASGGKVVWARLGGAAAD